jgi:hypothetical protein
MEFGFRKTSLKKRIAARTFLKRYIRCFLGLKAPGSDGWLTNLRRAAYNRVYCRIMEGCAVLLFLLPGITFVFLLLLVNYLL